MRVDQSKLLPLKQKRADTSWIPTKRMCERDLVPVSRVHHPEIFEYPFFNRMQSESFPYLYDSDSNVVISAPTASGKTALMELAILRNWEKGRGQTLYLAPLKALCQERREDWSRRLARVGMKCVEVTGDSLDSDLQSFRKADIALATPEKWDSVTRKGFAPISLLLIDEVHILEQETRGATLEAVVSRMKLVYSRPDKGPFRIVAISATIPNIEDIAAWLGTDVILNYDSSYRPVPLTVKVLGYQKAQNQFKFEQALTFKLFGVIQRYSDQKSTLVFCQTQKGTINAAKRLVQDAGTALLASPQQASSLTEAAGRLKDKQLAEVILCGIGFHNAGLSPEDRMVIEQLFLAGGIVVLCTTSTLAIGVNLPCHLVVVKSTMAYRGTAEGYTEYSSLEVLQMIGRAGRPQFDHSGTAVIMTEIDKIPKYESLVLAQEIIESALSKSMIEHINAEIALGSVTCEREAVDWLHSTFFYIRAKACPGHYQITGDVERELGEICRELMRKLESFHLVRRQQDKFMPTTLGRTVSSNCVQVDTVINFQETVHMDISAEDLLKAISSAREFEGYPSKMDQRKDLNLLNMNSGIRFRIKGAINSFDKKVFLLLQAGLAGCPMDSWELRQQVASVGVVSRRVVNVLREYCLFHDLGRPLALTLIWGRQFAARLWDDDPLVCKQIPGIGDKLARALSLGGITSFSELLSADPRRVELLCGKNPPFGSNVKSFVAGIPRFVPTAEVEGGGVKVTLRTESVGHPDVNASAVLLLTLSSGSILAYRRLTLSDPHPSFTFPLKSESPILLSIIVNHFGVTVPAPPILSYRSDTPRNDRKMEEGSIDEGKPGEEQEEEDGDTEDLGGRDPPMDQPAAPQQAIDLVETDLIPLPPDLPKTNPFPTPQSLLPSTALSTVPPTPQLCTAPHTVPPTLFNSALSRSTPPLPEPSPSQSGGGPMPQSFFRTMSSLKPNSSSYHRSQSNSAAFFPPAKPPIRRELSFAVPKPPCKPAPIPIESVSEVTINTDTTKGKPIQSYMCPPPSFPVLKSPAITKGKAVDEGRVDSGLTGMSLLYGSADQTPAIFKAIHSGGEANSPFSAETPYIGAKAAVKWSEPGPHIGFPDVSNLALTPGEPFRGQLGNSSMERAGGEKENREKTLGIGSLAKLACPLGSQRVSAPSYSFDSIFSDI